MVLTIAQHPVPALARLMELRIDVPALPLWLTAGFSGIYERLHTRGDKLHNLPRVESPDPQFEIHEREKDGEFYLYVEDLSLRRLAGYTVFKRLLELDCRADRHVRAPHSRYLPRYQRLGLASTVYKWALEREFCLMTGTRQSPAAHALWHSLGKRYELGYVELRDKALFDHGPQVSPDTLGALHTRMLMLGAGWTTDRFCEAAGMQPHPARLK